MKFGVNNLFILKIIKPKKKLEIFFWKFFFQNFKISKNFFGNLIKIFPKKKLEFFFQNLKIYSIEVICANSEGYTTIFIFYPKFAYDLVRTTVPPSYAPELPTFDAPD